ncbi:MAG TPA: hypothetical protein VJ695_09485 [Nitrososphaera sp.]|nr:hypothetical protein [Nitrososphaera sp.]
MSVEEKLVNRILSVGSVGIKKTDLRRELGDIETHLEKLISQGDVFIDKRSNAYFCFHKTHYVQSLLNTDARFKLTYDMIKSIDDSINRSTKDLLDAVETMKNNISNLASIILEMKTTDNQSQFIQKHPLTEAQEETLSVQDFKEHFDIALSNSASSSMGWTELADIRNHVCTSHNMSSEEFYRLVGELMSMDQDNYELSTGGREGIMVRGLLHGFVRCI